MPFLTDAMQEARPLLVRMAVDGVRALFHSGPAMAAAQPQTVADDEHGGCPWCAAHDHIALAAVHAYDAAHTNSDLERQVWEQKLVSELERAYRCLDVSEVVLDRDGVEMMAAIVKLTSVRDQDYDAQARELLAIKAKCITKARGRAEREPML